MRKLVIWLIALALIVLGMIGVVNMKYQTDSLKDDYQTQINCPEEVLKVQAYIDQQKQPPSSRQGLMHCYCLKEFKSKGSIKISFKDMGSETNFCGNWFLNWTA